MHCVAGLALAAGNGSVSTTAMLFHAVNIADTVKLILLGVAVFAATRLLAGRRSLPRWLQILGYALLPVLVIGGAAFAVNSGALNAVLTASLLLLLLWVAAVTLAATRHSPNSPPPVTAPGSNPIPRVGCRTCPRHNSSGPLVGFLRRPTRRRRDQLRRRTPNGQTAQRPEDVACPGGARAHRLGWTRGGRACPTRWRLWTS